jgi:hypothetical protein
MGAGCLFLELDWKKYCIRSEFRGGDPPRPPPHLDLGGAHVLKPSSAVSDPHLSHYFHRCFNVLPKSFMVVNDVPPLIIETPIALIPTVVNRLSALSPSRRTAHIHPVLCHHLGILTTTHIHDSRRPRRRAPPSTCHQASPSHASTLCFTNGPYTCLILFSSPSGLGCEILLGQARE